MRYFLLSKLIKKEILTLPECLPIKQLVSSEGDGLLFGLSAKGKVYIWGDDFSSLKHDTSSVNPISPIKQISLAKPTLVSCKSLLRLRLSAH